MTIVEEFPQGAIVLAERTSKEEGGEFTLQGDGLLEMTFKGDGDVVCIFARNDVEATALSKVLPEQTPFQNVAVHQLNGGSADFLIWATGVQRARVVPLSRNLWQGLDIEDPGTFVRPALGM